MICDVCGKRWSPHSTKLFRFGDVEKGEAFVVPLTDSSNDEWIKLYDSDIKLPCRDYTCSLN